MASQRNKWKAEMLRDYPNIEPYFVDILLDLWEKHPEYVKKLHKKKFKDFKHVETPKEIVGSVSVINNPSDDFLAKYFQPPLEIKEEIST